LVSYSSTITMMHGPIHKRSVTSFIHCTNIMFEIPHCLKCSLYPWCCRSRNKSPFLKYISHNGQWTILYWHYNFKTNIQSYHWRLQCSSEMTQNLQGSIDPYSSHIRSFTKIRVSLQTLQKYTRKIAMSRIY